MDNGNMGQMTKEQRLARVCELTKELAQQYAEDVYHLADKIQTRARNIEREEKSKSEDWDEERWQNGRWSEAILAAGYAEKANRRCVEKVDEITTTLICGLLTADDLKTVARLAGEIADELDELRQIDEETKTL